MDIVSIIMLCSFPQDQLEKAVVYILKAISFAKKTPRLVICAINKHLKHLQSIPSILIVLKHDVCTIIKVYAFELIRQFLH